MLNLNEMMELQRFVREGNKAHNKKVELEKRQREQEIKKGITFEILVEWNGKIGLDAFSEFEIDGYNNAMMIFNEYRKNGLEMNLKYIKISLKGEKVKKVTFKYNK